MKAKFLLDFINTHQNDLIYLPLIEKLLIIALFQWPSDAPERTLNDIESTQIIRLIYEKRQLSQSPQQFLQPFELIFHNYTPDFYPLLLNPIDNVECQHSDSTKILIEGKDHYIKKQDPDTKKGGHAVVSKIYSDINQSQISYSPYAAVID